MRRLLSFGSAAAPQLCQAATADPLLGASLEPHAIEALTEEMLVANLAYLPAFNKAAR